MSYDELKQVAALSSEFREAVLKESEKDAKLSAKIVEDRGSKENREFTVKINSLFREVAKQPQNASKQAYDFDPNSEKPLPEQFLQMHLLMADSVTRVLLSARSQEEAAKSVPAGLKNKKSIAILRQAGATNLASLAAFKK
jgi:hypothetical protein